jgi:hypothetical protein
LFRISVENTNKLLKSCVRGVLRGGPCWGNARHRPKHAATRLHPAVPPEAHAECFFAAGANGTNMPSFFAAGANGTNMGAWWSARRKATANDSNSSKVHRREG